MYYSSAQASDAGEQVTVDAVVTAFFKEHGLSSASQNGGAAHAKMVEKLSKELDWLSALEQYLVKYKSGSTQAEVPPGEQ